MSQSKGLNLINFTYYHNYGLKGFWSFFWVSAFGFLRFNFLRLTSPISVLFGFLRFILLKLTSPIAGSVLWISPL